MHENLLIDWNGARTAYANTICLSKPNWKYICFTISIYMYLPLHGNTRPLSSLFVPRPVRPLDNLSADPSIHELIYKLICALVHLTICTSLDLIIFLRPNLDEDLYIHSSLYWPIVFEIYSKQIQAIKINYILGSLPASQGDPS